MSRVLLPLALLVASACTREITIERAFNVDASQAPAGGACTLNTRTVDLTDIGVFESLKDRVTAVEVRRADVTVVNPQTQPTSVATTVSGAIWVSDVGSTDRTPLASFDPLSLTADAQASAVLNPDGVALLGTLATDSPWAFDLTAEGCADAYPAHFSLEADVAVLVSFKLF
ncbi:MAG: hypothetical protein ACKVPX_02845 [Myxococcaceae bacterium]